ncbi:S8 family serine peptidase [Actinokineospora guangxiensis]|uniref:S8 family serine peptidase n=1 Tax=Actinokineospora guangxiensis TaxID=1490288 RepID=A0ABW0EMP1_9PSEU
MKPTRSLILAAAVITSLGVIAGPVAAAPAGLRLADAGPGRISTAAAEPIADSYLALLADEQASPDVVKRTGDEVARQYGITVVHLYTSSLKGFAVKADAEQARALTLDRRFRSIWQDAEVRTTALQVQNSPSAWGLNRIDQRSLPMDTKYHYPNTASSVKAYIIDTGIRYTHQEFNGQAIYGIDTVGGVFPPGNDCNGHGTHVAGTVGGQTMGVAKDVQLVSVRVLNCAGAGSYAGVIAGVDWVTNNSIMTGTKAVANMSLGGPAFPPLNTAVANSIAANVHYSVSAGNSNNNACLQSPASTPAATTVGATTNTDARAPFSSFGTCLDLFAPGVNITSAWATSDTAYQTISGTSMAAPHATGTAALWRHKFPADTAWQTAAALADNATPGVVSNAGLGSPNKLLFMGMVPA